MEVHEKLQDLRRRVLRSEEISAAEYKELLDEIREDRLSAGTPKERKSKASNIREVDPDDIFGV